MYTQHDFKFKKDLIAAVEKGEMVGVFQPGPFGPEVKDGTGVVEGPHGYHKWYASVVIKDMRVISAK